MAERINRFSESHELLQSYSPAWLAGIFEVGGSMHFEIKKQNKKYGIYTYSYPFLKLEDSGSDTMLRLQRIVGGKVNTTKTNRSSQWYIMGQSAVGVAINMAPYAPSRREIIGAFGNWENAGSMKERVEIAKEMKCHNRIDVKEEDYEDLVKDPDFLAGAIDSRGSIYMGEAISPRGTSYGWVYPRLDICSSNIALLKALQKEYDGHIQVIYEEGETVKGFGIEFVAKNTSARWRAGDKICKELAQITGDRIKLNLEGIQLIQT